MSDTPSKDTKTEAVLDEYAVSELKRFFLLLDKWDREAKGEIVEPSATQGASGELQPLFVERVGNGR